MIFPSIKATEFRQFMVYTGKLVMKSVLPRELYLHFMALSVAMSILLSPRLVEEHHQFARDLLVYFVEKGREYYGQEFLVYSVHSLVHLTDEAVEFGNLDMCGAFKFESYLYDLKRMVRSGNNPLAQVVKRINEKERIFLMRKQNPTEAVSVTRPNNSYILSEAGCCCEVLRQTHERDEAGNYKYVCRVYIRSEPLFNQPCDSRIIGVHKVTAQHSRIRLLDSSVLAHKAIMIEKSNGSAVFMALLHVL